MIQTVLFDFDGTLFDTGEGILRSVQYALEGFGIHETDTARLRKLSARRCSIRSRSCMP